MDSDRFDRLARVLAATSTRRAITRSLAGLSLGGALLAALDETEAKHKKRHKKRHKKKKHCKPCQKRHHGKCKGTKPDGATCNGTGQCLDGTCNARPDCLITGSACTPETAIACCSGTCRADGFCQNSQDGQTCLQTSDCITPSKCVGFRCQGA